MFLLLDTIHPNMHILPQYTMLSALLKINRKNQLCIHIAYLVAFVSYCYLKLLVSYTRSSFFANHSLFYSFQSSKVDCCNYRDFSIRVFVCVYLCRYYILYKQERVFVVAFTLNSAKRNPPQQICIYGTHTYIQVYKSAACT